MKNINLDLFPKTEKNNWKKFAQKSLKGINPDDALNWKNDASINLQGYYDKSDLVDLDYIKIFFKTLPNHRWKFYEQIEVSKVIDANKKALASLSGGADGIIFNLKNLPDWEVLLKNISINQCDIGTISTENFETKAYTGPHVNPLNGNAIKINELNPIKQFIEIKSKIGKGIKYIQRTAQKDFFLEIASIRAIRFLLSKHKFDHVLIHTSVPLHQYNEYQWFLNTTGALASILGGSHSIDIPTVIGDSRISRNTANLIREESNIKEYTDQCGGAYYIEVLTDKIIKEVSKKLDKNERR